MGAIFSIGEKKVRPGVYFRYENYGEPPQAGADDGKCAAVFRSNWGPIGKVVPVESYEAVSQVYGNGGIDGRTAVALEEFKGGARLVFAVRLGTGGTNGTYQIKDTAASPISVIQLTLKYPGSREFSLTIRPTASDPEVSELLLLEGTTIRERFTFDTQGVDGDQATALVKAVSVQGSGYISLKKLADSQNPLAVVNQEAITPGTDPDTYTAADYSNAFGLLEAYRFNTLAVDTDDAGIHMVMQTYLNRIYNDGKWVQGVVGETTDIPFDTRLAHASAYNDYQIVYVGGGFIDASGAKYEGWKAAARLAGMIAGTPSSESITHMPITGAVKLIEPLTNYQYEQAINSGMLTFSVSADNTVWVEQGINTLVNPGTKEDEGWKKIKRVKVRFELFQRLNDTVDRLVGRINNDADGQMTIIQAGNSVCNAMIVERKLLAGARCELDPDNVPTGDSAWFLVYADDIDALEKMHFVFKFRFAPSEVN